MSSKFLHCKVRSLLHCRKGEPGGLNDWTDVLLKKTATPQEVAHGFVFSRECTGKNLNDRAFVEMLYHLYMGREADAAGLNAWVTALQQGASREQVVQGFAGSVEFRNIVASYGL